jgi:cardiolipin synthase
MAEIALRDLLSIAAFLAGLLEIVGVVLAVQAILETRTSQGAIAWVIALVAVPLLSVPLYLVFGRNKFAGYVDARQSGQSELRQMIEQAIPPVEPYMVDLGTTHQNARVLEQLARLPFLKGNRTQLLIDGDATFNAILDAIDEAHDYILFQFYIVRDDDLGRRLKDRLIERAQAGVRVSFLYDEVGSSKISADYLNGLREAGVKVTAMRTTHGWRNRFQLNFRNHRKIVVIDGRTAFVGGHNVGDEYVGKHPVLTPWRDTHMRLDGPAVLPVQLSFLEDWHWATNEVAEVNWQPQPDANEDKTIFVLPSGPADEYETCGLFFTHVINTARERVWIASPYFVPDESVIGALKLAVMRGVDVRILFPEMSDNRFIKRAAMSYVPQIAGAGVKFFLFQRGFMHQKVLIVDDRVSTIGTANFDNRSFRLNFEISILTIDEDFTREVATMLENDFSHSRELTADEVLNCSLLQRIVMRVARLFSPIL